MLQVAAQVWNDFAPTARSLYWRCLMSMDSAAQHLAMDQLADALIERGAPNTVALAYRVVAPLLAECEAISEFVEACPSLKPALPELTTAAEAVVMATLEYRLSEAEQGQLHALLLEPPPELPVMASYDFLPRRRCPGPDEWAAEAACIDIQPEDFSVAGAAEVTPEELCVDELRETSEDFDASFSEWFDRVAGDQLLILAYEQACIDGQLPPLLGRAERLQGLPGRELLELGAFWSQCPDKVARALGTYFLHLVRSERARRTGSADWILSVATNSSAATP